MIKETYLWTLRLKGTNTFLTNNLDWKTGEFIHVKDPSKAQLWTSRRLCREDLNRKCDKSLYTPAKLMVFYRT